MRLINSDGQIVNAKQKPASGSSANRNENSIVIDTGKHAAVLAICAVICGGCAVVAFGAVDRQHEILRQYSEDSLYTQDQYQKERNHVIELEARLKILGDEVQELKHHVRR